MPPIGFVSRTSEELMTTYISYISIYDVHVKLYPNRYIPYLLQWGN